MLAHFAAIILAFALSHLIAAPEASAARGDRWSVVGEARLDDAGVSRDIDLRNLNGAFMAFRLRLVGGSAKFSTLKLSYADGTSYVAERSFALRNGESTKVLDFDRGGRFIDSITVSYQASAGAGGRPPRLEILGLQSARGRLAKRPGLQVQVASKEAPPLPASLSDALPQLTGGILIGSSELNLGADRGTVQVRKEMAKFGRLRLQVKGHDLFVQSIRVAYEDGSAEWHKIELHIPEGRTTDWVGIDGTKFIRDIEISHAANPEKAQELVRVDIMAELADGWLSASSEAAKYNDGWMLLGAQPASFEGFDTGIIAISETADGFKRLRLMARGRAVTIDQIRVVYAEGNEDVVPVRTRIGGDSAYGPVELRDAPRKVREIHARYRSRFIDPSARSPGAAIVEVWAQR